jgi:hypothetical protein
VGGAHEDAFARGGASKDPSAAASASAGGGGGVWVWDGWALPWAVQHVQEELARATQHTAELERTMEQKQAEHAKEKRAFLAELAEMRAAFAELPPSPAVRVRRGRTAPSASADGPAALQASDTAAQYMGKVAAWQRALSGADFAEADGPVSPSTDGWSSVSSMRSTHEAERLSATPTPLDGCTHDSAVVRAAATAARCSRLGGALQLGERRGHSAPDAHGSVCVCCAQPETLIAKLQALLSQYEARPAMA